MNNMSSIELFLKGSISFEDFEKLAANVSEDSVYNTLGLTNDEFALYRKLGKDAMGEIISTRTRKANIIENAKSFFRDEIAENHKQNTEKLRHLNEFNLNPFLDKYKANFLTGNNSAISMAKALIYPRILGTSINTTFGTKLQKFCSSVLEGYASTTSGIDIEFMDLVDGRKKYCQIKAGPNTINKDDVKTIDDHFKGIKNLARTNNLNIGINDLIVGVFYGLPEELSTHYKNIQKTYPVYVGKGFWYHLTGDEYFYTTHTNAIGDVAAEYDSSKLIESVIIDLANEIRNQIGD